VIEITTWFGAAADIATTDLATPDLAATDRSCSIQTRIGMRRKFIPGLPRRAI